MSDMAFHLARAPCQALFMVSLSGLITPSGGRKYDFYFKDKEIEAQMKASHLLKAELRLEHGCVQPQTCILLSWWESN